MTAGTGWLDVSAGVAGDMLLAAFVDAGVPLDVPQSAVDRVLPGAVRLTAMPVRRGGMRATQVHVQVTGGDPVARTPAAIADLLAAADLPGAVRAACARVFDRLVDAEARVHGIDRDAVRLHEVGALDAIADVVGVCAALDHCGAPALHAGPVGLGTGHVRTAHGELPVPVPAVLDLLTGTGWPVHAAGPGERATPTGVALLTTLASPAAGIPDLAVTAVGVGAGSRDPTGRPNVVRLVLGDPVTPATAPGADAGPPGARHEGPSAAVLLETTVDDLDPRLWPTLLARLLAEGAYDAWLTPVLMKKGRPGHVLSVLCPPARTARLREVVLRETSTLGVRETAVARHTLAHGFVTVDVAGQAVRVKVAHRDGRVLHVTPEFVDVAAAAAAAGRPEREVLLAAQAAAVGRGLRAGAPYPG